VRRHHDFVIAGLDPAIHATMPHAQRLKMDHRVKPGGDVWWLSWPGLSRPSTSLAHSRSKDVDARLTRSLRARPFLARGSPMPGHRRVSPVVGSKDVDARLTRSLRARPFLARGSPMPGHRRLSPPSELTPANYRACAAAV
jgi:hypothetical protein